MVLIRLLAGQPASKAARQPDSKTAGRPARINTTTTTTNNNNNHNNNKAIRAAGAAWQPTIQPSSDMFVCCVLCFTCFLIIHSMPQAPLEAHRRRVWARDIAPRLAHFESTLRFLSHLSGSIQAWLHNSGLHFAATL